jgi:agmatinase
MDIVEVSPPYDHAETTAMIANRAALEAISALAVRRVAGKPVRWAGVPFQADRFPTRHGTPPGSS